MSDWTGRGKALHQRGGEPRYKRHGDSWEEVRPRLHNGAADIVDAINAREDFHSGNLRGEVIMSKYDLTHRHGRLEGESLARWEKDWENVDYVVWSYYTPIAWHTQKADVGMWVYSDQHHSATTSRHQSIVRRALNVYHIPNVEVIARQT